MATYVIDITNLGEVVCFHATGDYSGLTGRRFATRAQPPTAA